MYLNVLICSAIAFLMMQLVVPFLIKLADTFRLLDEPDNDRKIHFNRTPLVGGIAIAISFFLIFLLGNSLFNYSFFNLKPVFYGGLILLVTGVIDDKINVKPTHKLIIQFFAAYFFVTQYGFTPILFDFLHLSILPIGVQQLLLMVLIVGVVNAYNLLDGIDGLAGILFVIGFCCLAIVAFLLGQYNIISMMAILVASTTGFLKFNFSEYKKVFLGDAGSLFLSYLLITTGLVLIEQAATTDFSQMVMLVVFSIVCLPLVDAIRVFYGRVKSGNSPFKADQSHVHHILLRFKFSVKDINITMAILSVILISISTCGLFLFNIYIVLFLMGLSLMLMTFVINLMKAFAQHKEDLHIMESE